MFSLTTFFTQHNLFETLSPLLASADGADSTFRFWAAAVIFVGTFVIIATEKIHKTAAVLVGSALMLLFVLPVGHHEASAPQTPDPLKGAPAAVTMKVEKTADSSGKAVKLSETPQQISSAVRAAELETVEKYEKLDSYSKYVNFDVIFTLAGMMVMVNILSKTGLFQYIAIKSVKFAKGQPARTMILLVLATAFLSAFLDNVTTVLLVVPVTFVVSTQMKVSPVPFILAETMASNIGGTATLIGDPPNLLIGSMVGLNFMAFLINLAPFIVVLLLGYCAFLYFHYSKHMVVTVEQRAKIMEMDERTSITDAVTLKKAGTIMLLTAYSEREFIEKAKVSGVSGYLVKPIDEKSLIPSIELAVARSQDIHRLRKDYEKVSSRLEDRGVIEKAKGLVMAEQEMTEQQAYDYIRGLSLTKHLSMRKVSEMLLRRSGE